MGRGQNTSQSSAPTVQVTRESSILFAIQATENTVADQIQFLDHGFRHEETIPGHLKQIEARVEQDLAHLENLRQMYKPAREDKGFMDPRWKIVGAFRAIASKYYKRGDRDKARDFHRRADLEEAQLIPFEAEIQETKELIAAIDRDPDLYQELETQVQALIAQEPDEPIIEEIAEGFATYLWDRHGELAERLDSARYSNVVKHLIK